MKKLSLGSSALAALGWAVFLTPGQALAQSADDANREKAELRRENADLRELLRMREENAQLRARLQQLERSAPPAAAPLSLQGAMPAPPPPAPPQTMAPALAAPAAAPLNLANLYDAYAPEPVSKASSGLDLGRLDPLPDSLTWNGITLYGTVDVGGAYQTHGTSANGAFPPGLEYNIVGANNMHVPNLGSLAPNGMSQSFVGLRIEEALGGGWTALGKIETGFEPTSGELADGCASLARNNGVVNTITDAKGDFSRCGQFLNGEAYVGVGNAAFGTLTVGRQNSLLLDNTAVYDPQHLAYAFSLLGYSEVTDGTGDAESARWDNSAKYFYQYGPFHAAGMYGQGGPSTGLFGPAFGGNVGVTWRGFSVDAVYDAATNAVSSTSMSDAACAALGLTVPACGAEKVLAGTISDNKVWAVMGKYTWDLGGPAPAEQITKAKDYWAPKIIFYGGYERVTYANPSEHVLIGSETVGGYILGAVNNSPFDTNKLLDVYWGGVSYENGHWRLTAAYYGEHQNSWLSGAAFAACTGLGTPAVTSNCAGNVNAVSGVIDYQVTKHFDIYTGVQYSMATGGFVAGFTPNPSNTTTWMAGLRLQFF